MCEKVKKGFLHTRGLITTVSYQILITEQSIFKYKYYNVNINP